MGWSWMAWTPIKSKKEQNRVRYNIVFQEYITNTRKIVPTRSYRASFSKRYRNDDIMVRT